MINSLEFGQPLGLIATVYERSLSSTVELRAEAAEAYPRSTERIAAFGERETKALEQSLYASKIVSYARGFALLAEASRSRDWALDLRLIARIWRNGCIIARPSSATSPQPMRRIAPYPTYCWHPSSSRRSRRLRPTGCVLSPAPSSMSARYRPSPLRSATSSLTSRRLPANMVQAQR